MFNGYTWQTRTLEVRPDRMGEDVNLGTPVFGLGGVGVAGLGVGGLGEQLHSRLQVGFGHENQNSGYTNVGHGPIMALDTATATLRRGHHRSPLLGMYTSPANRFA